MHLPDFGDFQMSQIDGTPDPHPFSTRVPKDGKKGEGMETEEGEGAQRRETLEILDMADPDKQVLLSHLLLSFNHNHNHNHNHNLYVVASRLGAHRTPRNNNTRLR